AARAAGVPVRRRTQWLPELTSGYRLVAVAGSHGKTTTSAMLALVLRDAGLDPTAVVGGQVSQLGGSADAGCVQNRNADSDIAGLSVAIAARWTG
nr:UDP-N-acetylmuramate--L-alanine ligase [Micromonospora sp. DSM 115978]